MHVHLLLINPGAENGHFSRPLPHRVSGRLSPRRKAKSILMKTTGVDARPVFGIGLTNTVRALYRDDHTPSYVVKRDRSRRLRNHRHAR
jgi:hypothetical protein